MRDDFFFREQLLNRPDDQWIQVFILVLIGAYAITRMIYPKYWSRFASALFFSVEGDRLLFEQNTNIARLSLILNILASLSFGLFIFLILSMTSAFMQNQPDLLRYVTIWLIFTTLTSLKYAGNLALGYLFKNQEAAVRLNHPWLIQYKIFGFLMVFWSVMLILLPPNWSALASVGGTIFLGIMLIMSTLKGLLELRSSGISLLYGILYLCTLEFLPVLLIVSMILY